MTITSAAGALNSITSTSIRKLFILLTLVPNLLFAQEQDSTAQGSSLAVFPAISFAPETSLQFGAAAVWVVKSETTPSGFQRQSTLSPFFIYTLKNQIITAVNANLFTASGNAFTGSVRFFNFPDSYFGLGNDNDPDVSEQYTNIFFQVEGRFLKQVNETLFYGLAWDLQTNSIREVNEGGMLQSDNPVGIGGGNVIGLGPAFRYDTRNNAIYPSNGYLISARSLFNYVGDFNFSSYLFDARKYVKLWNENNILAFQVRGSFTGGDEVPFYKLPQLGGDDRLRGITNASLYRDRQMLYTQVEYRRPLFWRFGMTAFAGVGDVANRVGDFQLSEFKYVAGLGGRFAAIPKDKLNIRIDLGVARGGQLAFYAGISEAF